MRGHRLYALALEWRHQASAVPTQSSLPIRMAQTLAQMRQVALKLLQFLHQGSPLA
jgi:hypothetical protein